MSHSLGCGHGERNRASLPACLPLPRPPQPPTPSRCHVTPKLREEDAQQDRRGPQASSRHTPHFTSPFRPDLILALSQRMALSTGSLRGGGSAFR